MSNDEEYGGWMGRPRDVRTTSMIQEQPTAMSAIEKAAATAAALRGEVQGTNVPTEEEAPSALVLFEPEEAELATPDKLLEFLGQLDNALTQTYDVADAMKIKKQADAVKFLTDKLE